ncbi:V-type proton ATPase subunit H isoform X1 [Condylostylus longicornis]|uniref:V-type proton ATPase subunit H isoform X1 n=1 Tax=Condylostylus longicornis TaxID=2530218 RepID=UPI00244E2B97|nr:V-type proton ATPase subunit H isoform X1 [Condylostylus longicornis]
MSAANVKNMIPQLPEENIDMIAATSVLQQQAGDVRQNKPNWQTYAQSKIISNDEFQCVTSLDGPERADYLQKQPSQTAKTLLNMISHITKDQTIQYLLVMIDDILQEDRTRVNIFHDYSAKRKQEVWGAFLNLLNRQDPFIVNMSSRIIAKLACWGKVMMPKSDLNFYLQFLKDQLVEHATEYVKEMAEISKRITTVVHLHGHHSHGHGHHHGHHHDSKYHFQHHGNGHQNQSVHETYKEIPEGNTSVPGTPTISGDGKLQVIPSNEYIQSVGRCLQMMLRVDEYRFAFVSVDGISTIISILSSRVNFQVQYQLVFCLWVLTFNPLLAEKMNKFNVIPILADILNDCAKEKVTRIILAVFRNLIEKPEEPQVAKEHCIAMVQSKVLKQISILQQRRFDDEDIIADIEFLSEKLQNSVQDLSSFDEYATEVKSGRLEWSPVHKSAKFWRENAQRLNEKNYELLRILVHLLETSRDPLVLSVASYDIGEYVRHYPRGKHVIEQLGGKQLVMQLLSHEDPNVRYEALLAVQKLMVHNWEYLGKQLEKDSEKPNQKPISGKA